MIHFLTDKTYNNYLTHPEEYKYIPGKYTTNYLYWLFHNVGIKNITVGSDDSKLTPDDGVIYHFDHAGLITHGNYKKIQYVSDRPMCPNADMYLGHNLSLFKPLRNKTLVKNYGLENISRTWLDRNKWEYVIFPMAPNIKKCQPQFPPKKFKFVGRPWTCIPEIQTSEFITHIKTTYDVDLIFDYDNDSNDGTEDVYFCIRNPIKYSPNAKGNNTDGNLGHKTANRLYQSWYMGVPSIFETNSAMLAIRESKLDFLIADTKEEFEERIKTLTTDKELFQQMCDNSKKRENENTSTRVVHQWMTALNKLGIYSEY
jgi:hypothetical protein